MGHCGDKAVGMMSGKAVLTWLNYLSVQYVVIKKWVI